MSNLLATLQEAFQQLLLDEQTHKVRKAKAEADLAELSRQHARNVMAKDRREVLS